MNKVYEIIFDILVAITIMFLSVMIYFGLRNETVVKVLGNDIAEDFLLDAKKNGTIMVRDYENLIEKLSLTGNVYDLTLEHRHKVFEPEYRLRTIDEIIAAQNAAYTGPNIYDYIDITTNTPAVNNPILSGSLNTETNESVLASAASTGASVGHVHTDACYTGHKHTDIYGSADLSIIPVYTTYETSGDWYYHKHIHVYCAECGKELFHLYWFEQQGYRLSGYSEVFAYDSNGVPSVYASSSFNTTVSSEMSSISTEIYKFFNYAIVQTHTGGYYDRVSRNFSFTYGYLPAFSSDGSLTKWDYTGCKYVYGHPNYSACYPIGKMTKVNVSASNQNNSGNDTVSFSISCGDCGNLLMNFSISTSDSGYSSFRDGTQVWWNAYDTSGTIINKYKSCLYGGMGAYVSTSQYDTPVVMQLFWPIYNNFYSIAMNLPNSTETNYGNNNWNRTTTSPIDWPFTSWPTVPYYYDNPSVTWVPVTGCPYCGTFGSAYTCGQSGIQEQLCNQIVTSIAPTHATQTVYINDALITTVRATYTDGSTKVVLASTDFQTNTIGQNQSATLTYTYTVAGTTYTNTCPIVVNVIPRNKTCVNDHIYNLNSDGTDDGCPYCKAYVKNLRMINPNTTTVIITIGKSLQESGVTVLATYYDGHTETLTSEYVDNLDKDYYGTQQITIGYKGVTFKIMVKTVCAQITCDICSYVYNLYPDGTNPGCPRCISKTPIFTGNVLEKEEAIFTTELLEKLYSNGKYVLNQGDSLSMIISIKNSTLARNILRRVYPSMSDGKMMFHQSVQIKTK